MLEMFKAAAVLIGVCTAASAATLSIENSTLVLQYDDSSAMATLTEKASGETFLRAGKFETAPGAAHVEAITDPVFGAGRRVQAPRQGGGTVQFELYPALPFLVIRGEVRRESGAIEDIKSMPVASIDLDLGKPVGALRTMGTAGLTTPDANPGSYLFLTLADPSTRRGIVSGWLTAERGDGVIFSAVTGGRVQFKTRLDYGRLRLRSGDGAKVETLVIGLFDDARLGQEQFADAIARQLDIHLHAQTAGYCTWYSNPHGGAADEKAIVQLAESAAEELKPFGFTVVQIDDKWQDGKERNGPARRFNRVKPDGPYPHGMQPVAERLKSWGSTPAYGFCLSRVISSIPSSRSVRTGSRGARTASRMRRLGATPRSI